MVHNRIRFQVSLWLSFYSSRDNESLIITGRNTLLKRNSYVSFIASILALMLRIMELVLKQLKMMLTLSYSFCG